MSPIEAGLQQRFVRRLVLRKIEARMGLRRRAQEGKVRLGAPNRPEVYARRKPLLTGDELQKLLSETRGDS